MNTMKRITTIITLLLLMCTVSEAQTVQRDGDTFTQVAVTKSRAASETLTQYTYVDSKGNIYPIYLSSVGKAFIKKTSKKTGKEYRQYIPEVGRQINPDAYKPKSE